MKYTFICRFVWYRFVDKISFHKGSVQNSVLYFCTFPSYYHLIAKSALYFRTFSGHFHLFIKVRSKKQASQLISLVLYVFSKELLASRCKNTMMLTISVFSLVFFAWFCNCLAKTYMAASAWSFHSFTISISSEFWTGSWPHPESVSYSLRCYIHLRWFILAKSTKKCWVGLVIWVIYTTGWSAEILCWEGKSTGGGKIQNQESPTFDKINVA